MHNICIISQRGIYLRFALSLPAKPFFSTNKFNKPHFVHLKYRGSRESSIWGPLYMQYGVSLYLFYLSSYVSVLYRHLAK